MKQQQQRRRKLSSSSSHLRIVFTTILLIVTGCCWSTTTTRRRTSSVVVVVEGHLWTGSGGHGDGGGAATLSAAVCKTRRLMARIINADPTSSSSSSSTTTAKDSNVDNHQQQQQRSVLFFGRQQQRRDVIDDHWMVEQQQQRRRRKQSVINEAVVMPVSSSSSSSIVRRRREQIQADVRGGTVVAGHIVRTMTARRMETFKFLSGGVAGTVAACITNPLEVIKTQLQSSNKELIKARGHPVAIAQAIMDRDGVAGFWRGLPPTLVGIIPSRSAYFYAYQRAKTFLNPTLPEGSPANALIAGFFAGIVGNTLTNPIWMVRTRMQLLIDHTAGQKQYAGYGDAIKTIFREEGIGGFYRGITASYWGCAEGALQFLIYEQFKSQLIARQNDRRKAAGLPPTNELPKATYFWAAAASKGIAAVVTYPHEVARTRMREQARAGVFKYTGMWQTLRVMAQEEGAASLYSGMGVHMMKVIPNSALMFLTYEVVRGWLDGYQVVDNNNGKKRKSRMVTL